MKNRRKHWRSVVTVVGVALLLAAGLVGTKPHGVSAQSEPTLSNPNREKFDKDGRHLPQTNAGL